MAKKKLDSDVVLHLDPATITASDNIRHTLREGDIDRMVASIIDRGGIQEPVSVELKADGSYALIKGFIRHAAATKMNLQGAGITVPALVRSPADAVDRLKTQVAENVARASLSPIDTAISISKLLDAGVSKLEIRNMFARAGTSKGATVSPMSNSWVNKHLAMLEMPADIIAKIHNGEVSPEAAYELSRVPEERRAVVLEAALEAVAKAAAREEKDEEKLLKAEQAEAKEAAKAEETAKALVVAQEEVTTTQRLYEEKLAALRVTQAAPFDPLDVEADKAHKEAVKAGTTDVKAAQSLVKKAKNKVAKLAGEKSKAEELKDKLAAARSGATPAVGPTAIKKAAAKDKDTPAGAKAAAAQPAAGVVAPTASQIRDGVKDMAKTENTLVVKVVGIFSDFCKGTLTPKLALAELEKVLKLKVPAKQ